jgi:hypothetical protein
MGFDLAAHAVLLAGVPVGEVLAALEGLAR